jgi:hypothetical protein
MSKKKISAPNAAALSPDPVCTVKAALYFSILNHWQVRFIKSPLRRLLVKGSAKQKLGCLLLDPILG